MNNSRIRLLKLSVFVICVVVVAMVVLLDRIYPFDDRVFSATVWRADDLQRTGMTDSLIRDHLPQGMREDQVLELLGPSSSGPHGTANRWDTTIAVDYCHEYHLGGWSIGGMDDAYLVVCFDKQGTLIEARVDGY